LPKNFDSTVADEIISLSTAQARQAALALVAEEGVFAGTSSGATLWAATQLAARPENTGKLIVVLLPDTGERYLASTTLDG
jgi:cysteine synthase